MQGCSKLRKQGGMCMATISGYDSSSLNVLFSSLNRSGNSNNYMSGLMGINVTDYATIRSGSYYKLLKSYYSMDSSDEVKKIVNKTEEKEETEDKKTESGTDSTTTSTSNDSATTISKVESAAEELGTSLDTLLKKGKDSVFAVSEVKDEEGNVTEKYDTDKSYKAVNEFVTDYNALLDSTYASKSQNIISASDRMARITGYNESSLEKIGITIGEDNKLKIDEATFKAADVEDVKKVFQNQSGFAEQINTQISQISYYAEREASKSNTYTSTGTYTNNYNTGTIYTEGI